jgi:hypothetical protein
MGVQFTGVRVEGAARLRSTLKKAGADMKELTALNRAAAEIVAARAKALAPVGDPKNGHISSTIRAGATQRQGIVRVGDKKRPYAHVIHWGWASRGIEPNPWVSLAAQQTEPVWVDLYWTGLLKVINNVSGD